MKKLINKLALSSASVLVLGIGCTGISHAAEPGRLTNTAKICPPLQISDSPSGADLLRRSDIRWAQTELRFKGFYHGSLDGIFGRATKEAVLRFQKDGGLVQTAALDPQTWAELAGGPGLGEGSSMPPAGNPAAVVDSPSGSGLGR